MNMFKKVNAKTVKEYLAAVPPKQKSTILALHKFILKTVPKLKAHFATNMIGYGKFKYQNHKNMTIDWPIIALANQKNSISVYVYSVINGEYVAEKNKIALGKVKVGRSCISIKQLADINLPVLSRVLKLAASNPGLTK